MNDFLTLTEIIKLFGREIYLKGKELFENNAVKNLTEDGNYLKGTVLEKDKSFNTLIKLEYDSNPKILNCDCKLKFSCRHCCASLIYYIKNGPDKKFALKNPLKDIEKEKTLEKIDISLQKEIKQHNARLLKLIEKIESRSGSINANKREAYKIVFSVFKKESLINDNQDKEWMIEISMISIKKGNKNYKIAKFEEEKITESMNKEEKEIFISLYDKSNFSDYLTNYLKYLVNNNGNILFYLNKNGIYTKLKIYEIKLITINFVFYNYDLKTNEILFIPEAVFEDINGICTSSLQIDHYPVYNHELLGIIINDGTFLFKKNKIENSVFISKILTYKDSYNISEIEYLKKFIENNFGDDVKINFNVKEINVLTMAPKIQLEIFGNYIEQCNIRIYFNYMDILIPYNETKSSCLYKKNNDNNIIEIVKRNEEAEGKIKDFLFYILKDELLKINRNRIWDNELNYDLLLKCNPRMFLVKYGKMLIDEGFEIRFKDKNKRISRARGNLSFTVVNSNPDWLDVETNFLDSDNVNEKIQINFNDIKNGIMETHDGFIIINENDIELISKLFNYGLKNDGSLKISKYNLYLINELYDKIAGSKGNETAEIRDIYKKLNNFENINKIDLPVNFNGTLRDYQKSGFYWLYFLYSYNINGCLADDMGLGKTIQTLCLLQKLKEEKSISVNLLIAPVITLSNWELEINKFAGQLKYLIHHGNNRVNEQDKLLNYDLIITSYHTLKRDIELFEKLNFNFIILDEAQYIKNSFSQVFKTVKILKSGHRLSLTGTPIENNTLELWSQMEFLNPNLLGNIKSFKARYTIPIESKNDIQTREELKKIIYPFILRRKKQDVAKDLPEKEEIILYLEMKNDQRNIYLRVKNYYKMKINRIIDQDGIKRSGIHIIDALLRLRQIALFPGIAKEDFKEISSCKIDQLKIMLEEIVSENHKVLIFSQFVKVLKIMQDYLNFKQYNYSYIDGSIKHRERVIKDFQEKEDNKIFLLSLKAGGVGINLTSADYVIIFDPWWNPAMENQAIDRAHRIGQTKKVIIYKYIVKNTIEEKILQLQERKKNLINDLITDDGSLLKLLNKDDIMMLFN